MKSAWIRRDGTIELISITAIIEANAIPAEITTLRSVAWFSNFSSTLNLFGVSAVVFIIPVLFV